MKEGLKAPSAELAALERASPHLSGFDFVLVVILKDALIAQTQPPWDPLLVLKIIMKKKMPQEKLCMCVRFKRERKKNRDTKTKYK